MKSARTIRILILASMTAPASQVRGDTFFDFGLRWTQWVPNLGKVQRFEKEETPTLIAVPKPSNSQGFEDANGRSRESVSEKVRNLFESSESLGTRYPSGGYSAPSSYIPVAPAPAPEPEAAVATSVPPPPVSIPAPSVPSYAPVPTQTAPNVYPVSMPPAANTGNTYPVSMPPSANYGSGAVISSKDRFDALIRMDGGPYPMSDRLLTGQPQAWYASPVVQNIYGGTPNDEQKRSFENDVLAKVEQTYAKSGINLNLTNDASAEAARTISVVAGAGYGSDDKVAGITVMNGDGFSFIDKLGNASNVDELEWAVARNVAHELLHAFNVGHHDTSGNYLDAAVANWDLLTSADTRFSDLAISDLRSKIAGGIPDSTNMSFANFAQHLEGSTSCAHCIAAQTLDIQPVPEPTTVALWLIGAGFLYRHHRQRRELKA